MSETRTIISREDAARFSKYIEGLPLPLTITWKEGDARSLNQNALLHKWYGEIAKAQGQTAAEVKGECHVAFGVPIRSRDPIWLRVWEKLFAPLSYEQQCFLFAKGILAMTRDMKKAELTEYMDAVFAEYTKQGIYLTKPEDD